MEEKNDVTEGEKSDTMPATSKIQNDIIGPALTDAQKLLGEYVIWLKSNSSCGGNYTKNHLKNDGLQLIIQPPRYSQIHLETHDLEKQVDLSTRVTENFSAGATSKLFEKQIREVASSNFLWSCTKFSKLLLDNLRTLLSKSWHH